MSEFQSHIEAFHEKDVSSSNISSLGELSSRVNMAKVDGNCPLCQDHYIKSERDYSNHVGKHLENLALFALPNTEDGSSQDDEDGDEDQLSGVITESKDDENNNQSRQDHLLKSPHEIESVGSKAGEEELKVGNEQAKDAANISPEADVKSREKVGYIAEKKQEELQPERAAQTESRTNYLSKSQDKSLLGVIDENNTESTYEANTQKLPRGNAFRQGKVVYYYICVSYYFPQLQ